MGVIIGQNVKNIENKLVVIINDSNLGFRSIFFFFFSNL